MADGTHWKLIKQDCPDAQMVSFRNVGKVIAAGA